MLHGVCIRNGKMHLNTSTSARAHRCVRLDVVKEDGSLTASKCFCPRSTEQRGMQARVLVDSLGQWVLKLATAQSGRQFQPGREACFLRRLRSVAWAPRLLCDSAEGFVAAVAGEPVSPHNLPLDWRSQVGTMLSDLYEHGIRHNDIWRPPGLQQAWWFGGASTEVMVRRNGRMSLVDFGWATSHDGRRCGCHVDDRNMHPQLSMYGMADVVSVHLLAQYEAVRDDPVLGTLSFCGAFNNSLSTSGSPHLARSQKASDHPTAEPDPIAAGHGPEGDCAHGTGGFFDLPTPSSYSQLGRDGTGWGPDKASLLRVFGSHLRACMIACRRCPQCAAFTPSPFWSGAPQTRKCQWSSTCKPLAHSDGAPTWHGGAIPIFGRGKPAVRAGGKAPSLVMPPLDATSSNGLPTARAVAEAAVGYCGGTPVEEYIAGTCKSSMGKGGWHLRELVGNLTVTGPLAEDGLTTDIVARCAAACAACSACAFFSVNLYNDDCSWFKNCDMTALETIPRGYRTFRRQWISRSETNQISPD